MNRELFPGSDFSKGVEVVTSQLRRDKEAAKPPSHPELIHSQVGISGFCQWIGPKNLSGWPRKEKRVPL